jgi:hypothetical protein
MDILALEYSGRSETLYLYLVGLQISVRGEKPEIVD